MYVFVLPAAGITLALLFFDLRIRKEGLRTSPEHLKTSRRCLSGCSKVDLSGDVAEQPVVVQGRGMLRGHPGRRRS